MSSNLPPGVTDSMCDGIDEECANCGHPYSMHEDAKPEKCDHVNCDCESFVEGEYEPDYDDFRNDMD